MMYVVGSGPAGVACAFALLRKGHEVTMLDAGLELEPERRNAVQDLRSLPQEKWPPQDLSAIKENMQADASGVPLKYAFGSDFPYRETAKHIPIESRGVGIVPSFARGGLSNVWGATLLPYTAKEFSSWPVGLEAMKPYYEKILEIIPMAAAADDLSTLFPLYTKQVQTLTPSRQAQAFLFDLQQGREQLTQDKIYFGKARLAVHAKETGQECVYCGLCMYGCPYGLIYNSGDQIPDLMKFEKFHYSSGVVVKKVRENGAQVEIEAVTLRDKMPRKFTGDKVFLACGTLATTQVLLESLGEAGVSVTLKDAQYFLFPFLRFRRTDRLNEEKLHTLSQIFLEILSKDVSPERVHLQVYTFNDLFENAIKKTLNVFYYPLMPIARAFLDRLFVVQGYLHSDLSPEIAVRWKRGALQLDSQPHAGTKLAIKRILQKLGRHKAVLQGIPLTPLLKIALPGRGFHSGGTFPMKSKPQRLETDPLGRPSGFRRVHAVDATVFPNIPSGPITFTVMANAYRIGTEHGQ